MSLAVAIQMDPIESINIDADSTFVLALEAQARGHALFHYLPSDLAFRDGRLYARTRPLEVRREKGNHFTFGTAESIDHYYHYRGPAQRDAPAPTRAAVADSRNNIPSTIHSIREVLKACEAIGMDEVIVRPGVEEIDQVDKLAELLR